MLGVRPTVRRFRTRPFGGCAAGVKFYGTVSLSLTLVWKTGGVETRARSFLSRLQSAASLCGPDASQASIHLFMSSPLFLEQHPYRIVFLRSRSELAAASAAASAATPWRRRRRSEPVLTATRGTPPPARTHAPKPAP
eukprot:349719-Chlamydomonas_euryale.AAC.9